MPKKPKWLIAHEANQARLAKWIEGLPESKQRIGLIDLVRIIRHFTGTDLKTAVALGRFLRDAGIVKKLKAKSYND